MACKEETLKFVKQIVAYDCWKTFLNCCVNDCKRPQDSTEKEFLAKDLSKQSVVTQESESSGSSSRLTGTGRVSYLKYVSIDKISGIYFCLYGFKYIFIFIRSICIRFR